VDVERIIDKALEKDREVRYQHASDLRTDLKRLKRDWESTRHVGITPTVVASGRHEYSLGTSLSLFRRRWGKRAILFAAPFVALLLAAVLWIAERRSPSMPELKQRQLTNN